MVVILYSPEYYFVSQLKVMMTIFQKVTSRRIVELIITVRVSSFDYAGMSSGTTITPIPGAGVGLLSAVFKASYSGMESLE
ncbi:hypothetical protein [Cryobacterium sp. Y29]|uniref:hypothetical protein n=1 Tax=Cryobacterium sp. Y29 TaxID=2048285 RepID=UPI0011B01D7E|nr:hypothetical protein [Cryobacterium sp. Y29]